LCIYDLLTHQIQCSSRSLPQLDYRGIVGSYVSPNGRFVHFCYSNSTILNDYAEDAADGVVGVDGKTFVFWQ
jgi:hypothetical protein